jgi:hypothetical protein
METLSAEYSALLNTYRGVYSELFFATQLNDFVDRYKHKNFSSISPSLSNFDSHFFSFFPKKFNRFSHKLGPFSSFGFGYFDDIR